MNSNIASNLLALLLAANTVTAAPQPVASAASQQAYCVVGQSLLPTGVVRNSCQLAIITGLARSCPPITAMALPTYKCDSGRWVCDRFCLRGSSWDPKRLRGKHQLTLPLRQNL